MKYKGEGLLVTCVLFAIALPQFFTQPVYADSDQSHYDCLVEAVYYEAGNQPFVGKIAVAQVILNRVNSKYYPNDVCGVVHQGPISKWWKEEHNMIVPIKWKCQFSYYCDGKDEVPYEGKSWNDSEHAAMLVLSNTLIKDMTEGATHYHADYVEPYWAKKMNRTVTIDNHLFFKR
tara:strand:- start:275 stop:799 length:525 start_codon:yes stop_codon:yes gene_type:complete